MTGSIMDPLGLKETTHENDLPAPSPLLHEWAEQAGGTLLGGLECQILFVIV